jgi:hypothetical protein
MLTTGLTPTSRRQFLTTAFETAQPLTGYRSGWIAPDEQRPLF